MTNYRILSLTVALIAILTSAVHASLSPSLFKMQCQPSETTDSPVVISVFDSPDGGTIYIAEHVRVNSDANCEEVEYTSICILVEASPRIYYFAVETIEDADGNVISETPTNFRSGTYEQCQ